MRAALIALLSLSVTACGGPKLSQNQREEVHDIAADVADDAADGAVSESERVAELEARIEALEERLGM